jgi:hypothetical protein
MSKLKELQQPDDSITAGIGHDRDMQRYITANGFPGIQRGEEHPVLQQDRKPRSARSPTETVTPRNVHHTTLPAGTANTQARAPISYVSVHRPWQEASRAAKMRTTSVTGVSPMERWKQETVREQPWNGATGTHVKECWERDVVERFCDTTKERDSDVAVERGSYQSAQGIGAERNDRCDVESNQ